MKMTWRAVIGDWKFPERDAQVIRCIEDTIKSRKEDLV
ncbi:unnamed protein product [Arabidopsis halleri]